MLTRCCAAALLLTVLTACGDDSGADPEEPASATRSTTEAPGPSNSSTPDGPTPPPTSGPSEPGTRIVASGSEFGQMLFDATDQAIYLFDIETTSKPACYDACAEAWPPVLTDGEPVAGRGIEAALLGTTDRTDGTTQVTYNDHPLYFYAHEGKGEVKCHDIFLNGGTWYVVQPDGDAAPPG